MWSILENVPCALEKKVYSSAFGWNVLKISMRSISSDVLLKTCVSLLIFYFDDLIIGVNVVLKSPTIIVLLSISPFMSVQFSSVTQSCPTLCDPMNRSTSKQKINKETQVLNDTLDEIDLIDIFRTSHPNAEEYTFFSSSHGTFSRIDHILCHK